MIRCSQSRLQLQASCMFSTKSHLQLITLLINKDVDDTLFSMDTLKFKLLTNNRTF